MSTYTAVRIPSKSTSGEGSANAFSLESLTLPKSSTSELLSSKEIRVLIENLKDESYSVRQKATAELIKRPEVIPFVREAVAHLDVNVSNTAIEILHRVEFKKEIETFRELGNFDAVGSLMSLKTQLLEKRKEIREVFPSPVLGTSIESELKNAELCVELDVKGLIESLYAGIGESKGLNFQDVEDIKSCIFNLVKVAVVCGNEEEIKQIFNILKKVEWQKISSEYVLDCLNNIATSMFNKGTKSSPDLSEKISRLDINGLHGLSQFIDSMSPGGASLLWKNRERIGSRTDTIGVVSDLNTRAILDIRCIFEADEFGAQKINKLGEFIYLNNKFLEMTISANIMALDSKSAVLKPFIDQWEKSSSDKDLEAMRTLIRENADFRFSGGNTNFETGVDVHKNKNLFIDHILRNSEFTHDQKVIWYDKIRSVDENLGKLVNPFELLENLSTPNLAIAVRDYFEGYEDKVIQCIKEHDLDALLLLEGKISKFANAIYNIVRISRDLESLDSPSESGLKRAFVKYLDLGVSPAMRDDKLSRLLKSPDGSDLEALLDRFDSDKLQPVEFVEKIYNSFLTIENDIHGKKKDIHGKENDIHGKYSATVETLAKQQRQRLLDAISSGDQENYLAELERSFDLVNEIDKKLLEKF